MSKLFSLDSGLYKFMSRLFDMLKLNAMWLLCSIPIVTIGAATTAAYTITLKMVDEEEGYIAGPFLKEFKANLFKGSALGIIQLIAMFAISLDFQLARASEKYGTFCLVMGIIATTMTVTHFIYAYPLLARYENSIINTLRNSHSISVKYLPKTIFLVVTLFIEYLLFYQMHWTLLFFGIIIGPACLILTISGFARQFFRNIERENELIEEEAKMNKAKEREGKWKEAFDDDEDK
ncbi:MAG: DUF624 domain-containing protein [Lachnospiraceae bacterium]|nr:DUF624 domain-containing protein [Lachnospiraceae bacterium]